MAASRLVPYLVGGALLIAGDRPWVDKKAADWTDDDTRLVLNESPWAKSVQAAPKSSSDNSQRSRGGTGRGGGMGRGGIGIGGVGIGLPGGMGRRGGGYPGGGSPGGRDDDRRESDRTSEPTTLRLRWESALPIRVAELKARDADAPTVDEGHYAIAVYGVPKRFVPSDSDSAVKELKKQAALKRDGKPDIKPSSVEVLQKTDGPVVVYLFPRSKEISAHDKRVEFDSKIGRLEFSQSFYLEDMLYEGKLEL